MIREWYPIVVTQKHNNCLGLWTCIKLESDESYHMEHDNITNFILWDIGFGKSFQVLDICSGRCHVQISEVHYKIVVFHLAILILNKRAAIRLTWGFANISSVCSRHYNSVVLHPLIFCFSYNRIAERQLICKDPDTLINIVVLSDLLLFIHDKSFLRGSGGLQERI